MTAFDTAWSLVKMARHVVDDNVELWDYLEAWKHGFGYDKYKGDNQDPFPEGYENLPKFLEREPMPNDYGWSNTEKTIEVDSHDDVPEEQRRFAYSFGGGDVSLYRAEENPKSEWRSYRAGQVDRALDGLRGDGYVYGRGWDPEPELPEGRDEPLTWEEMQEIHRQYYDDDLNWTVNYPWGGGIGRGDYVKIMLTPNEFLRLARKGHDEQRALEMAEKWKQNEGRTPIGMPYLSAELSYESDRIYPDDGVQPLSGPQSFKITGHEGRHRMAALRSLGYGDKPFPVHFELDSNSKHAFGKNPKGRNMGLEQALSEGVSFFHPESKDGRLVSYYRKPNTTFGSGVVENL
jgi:hypothetical protein